MTVFSGVSTHSKIWTYELSRNRWSTGVSGNFPWRRLFEMWKTATFYWLNGRMVPLGRSSCSSSWDRFGKWLGNWARKATVWEGDELKLIEAKAWSGRGPKRDLFVNLTLPKKVTFCRNMGSKEPVSWIFKDDMTYMWIQTSYPNPIAVIVLTRLTRSNVIQIQSRNKSCSYLDQSISLICIGYFLWLYHKNHDIMERWLKQNSSFMVADG